MPSKPDAHTRERNYCFTVNNYTQANIDTLIGLILKCKYIVYGKEVGESGTPHLQGFLVWKDPRTFLATKKLLPAGAHIEVKVRKSSFYRAAEYCKKDGDFSESGTLPNDPEEKGKRGAEYWEAIKHAAQQGRLDDIPAEAYLRFYATINRIMRDHIIMPNDAEDVTGVWYYGDAGAGKSRAARHNFPGAYMKMANKWWDGYRNEENVIIDDIDPRHKVLGHHLKIWADRYAFLAETKGSAAAIRPKKIVVTSQYPPERIWDDEPETVAAIRRRFSVVHFDKKWIVPPPVEYLAPPPEINLAELSTENVLDEIPTLFMTDEEFEEEIGKLPNVFTDDE